MALDTKKRLAVVGVVLSATLLWMGFANAQVDAAGSSPMPGSQTMPGVQPQPALPQTPGGFSADAGVGGGGFTPPPSFGTPDAGVGGSGPIIPDPLRSRDGGLGF